jgi:tRNA(Ile)-lysidine synthetase-like protein
MPDIVAAKDESQVELPAGTVDRLSLPAGVYVVAVSGGVDSVVLLDMLVRHTSEGVRLVVAHLDHGIRRNSADDRKFVGELASRYGLPFTYEVVSLGYGASENEARQARYDFLQKVVKACGAQAIVTAHHQDDVIETALFNLMRGTSYRGLASLRSRDGLLRPLLGVSKVQLIEYAERQGLSWREDHTNQDMRYARNRIRLQLVPKLTEHQREQLVSYIEHAAELNDQIDFHIREFLAGQPDVVTLDRATFAPLPHAVAREVIAHWLRSHAVGELDRSMIDRLVIELKVGHMGTRVDVVGGTWVQFDARYRAVLRPVPKIDSQ